MNSKIYRCGWCGCPTDEHGKVLEEELFKRVVSIVENYGDTHTEKTHGYCCVNGFLTNEPQRITRDMATDAGDPSLEGQWM